MQKPIYTYLRLRPPFHFSHSAQQLISISSSKDIQVPNKGSISFEQIFDNSSNEKQKQQAQQEIFQTIGPIVLNKLQKQLIDPRDNCTIISYGDTACGKTYTIFGTPTHEGLLFRTLSPILTNSALNNQIRLQIFQIYNQKIFDLSTIEAKQLKSQLLSQSMPIQSIQQLRQHITKCYKKRQNTNNVMNNLSGRSVIQAIFKIGQKYITFIDLPGHQASINPNDIVKKEIGFINTSLMYFEMTIEAIKQKKQFIPFGNCTLTRINATRFVKDTLFIVANINPYQKECINTLMTLKKLI